MLVASWVEERAGKSQERLSTPAMLDQLKRSAKQWGKSIVPLEYPSGLPYTRVGKTKTIRRRNSFPGIKVFKGFLQRGRNVQET